MSTQPARYEEPRRYDRDHDDRYKRKKRDIPAVLQPLYD